MFAGPHYKVQKLKIADADKYLDQSHNMGWRVTMMTVHPDGDHLIFLFEKASSDKDKKLE